MWFHVSARGFERCTALKRPAKLSTAPQKRPVNMQHSLIDHSKLHVFGGSRRTNLHNQGKKMRRVLSNQSWQVDVMRERNATSQRWHISQVIVQLMNLGWQWINKSRWRMHFYALGSIFAVNVWIACIPVQYIDWISHDNWMDWACLLRRTWLHPTPMDNQSVSCTHFAEPNQIRTWMYLWYVYAYVCPHTQYACVNTNFSCGQCHVQNHLATKSCLYMCSCAPSCRVCCGQK